MVIRIDTHKWLRFGGDSEYKIVSSCEMTERGHKDDPRFGVCIDVEETKKGLMWSTHEYNVERDEYYNGHYWMDDEAGAWNDYFTRCQEVSSYILKWSKQDY